jgi:hypothetical protein
VVRKPERELPIPFHGAREDLTPAEVECLIGTTHESTAMRKKAARLGLTPIEGQA